MAQLGGLGGDGVHPLGIAVADGTHADPRSKVDVLLSLQIPEGGPFSAVNIHVKTAVGLHGKLVVQRHQFLMIHIDFLLRCSVQHRADALVGQELNENGVGDASVQNDGVLYT